MASPLIVVAGPTGVGKSRLAIRLADALEGEIVNYDSIQIYRGFDIGSAKPSPEERSRVPHHLIDFLEATAEFNAADYARLAGEACESIASRRRRPILVGGTFFYLRALLSGLPEMPGRNEEIRRRLRGIALRPRGMERLHRWLSKIDPASGRKIAPADRHRIERALEVWICSGRPITSWETTPESEEKPAIKIALILSRPTLNEAIDRRVEEMYSHGLLRETAELLDRYPDTARPFGSIGYREAVGVLRGEIDREAAIAETKRRTRAYAKRQMTWLRSERNMHWVDASDADRVFRTAMEIIEATS